MNTKSTIQLIKEACEVKSQFAESLERIMDKYLVEDSIFMFKDGQVFEVTRGYFESQGEFNTLKEAMTQYMPGMVGIRIVGNSKFELGIIKNTLSECKDDAKILDIESLENIR
jgi:hypothetical protein